ncbi:MAG: 6-carboxytetrahydropterin synthase QueD [Thermodesulfobacteria bacterium]|nr:6-carboxytetrahydropterin synthase QueD [Thermodesulfobacteriota bacterium]
MFKIFVKTHFSSAHYLRNYPGNCEHLHGHNWDVTVTVKAEELNDIDVAMDFKDLKRVVAEIMKELDHKNLNELPAFKEKNPSSERLAQFIYERLEEKLAAFPGVLPDSVEVRETPSSGVIYTA